MWLIAGLGNPGAEYLKTRHNIGFMTIDYLVQGYGNPSEQNQFKSVIYKLKIEDHQVIFAKPQTFMNLSGESIQPLMGYYKIHPEHLIVIHDELDFPFGQIKIQKNRGHAGHNGIKSIHQCLGTSDYIRLKLGVGRPENPHIPVADHVLSPFNKEEQKTLPAFINKACDAVEAILFHGIQKASTEFN